ncbi:MAG TPA: hypothetical protein EYG11_17170 [Candidatus Latescibacteria bacterium]|nr:hypothetical protein [Candidatus Handelsmanbacteria bacterium]HIL10435.1 hypothetical protein [Candidatus Latescibacterota bacterium]
MPDINAIIHEPSGVPRNEWPLILGLPFAAGVLRNPTQIAISDGAERPLPASAKTLATWPDGSIKWALLDTQASLGPMERATYHIHTDTQTATAPLETPLISKSEEATIEIGTGPLTVRLNRRGTKLFGALDHAGRPLLTTNHTADFIAADENNTHYPGLVEDAVVEEQNPLRIVVKVAGGFVADDGTRLLGWQARLYFFANQPFFKIYHTFIHDQPAPYVQLNRLRFTLPLALEGERQAALGARQSTFAHGAEPQSQDQPHSLIQHGLNRYSLIGRERIDGRGNAHGWVHLADATTGVTIKLRHPWQNYPKAYTADHAGLSIDLYPDLSAFERPMTEPGRRATEIGQTEGVRYDGPLRIPQGMAKTHEIFVHCSPPGQDARQIDAQCLAFEEPLLLQLPSEYYATTGALGPFHPFREEHWPLELKIRRFCQTPNGLGLIDYGDQVHYEPEGDTLKTRTSKNLAYELPRSILRQYLRSGEQTLFRDAEAAVSHLIDVDTVHFSSEHPEWVGGPHCPQSQNHHFADTDEKDPIGAKTSHTWLGGLLDFYFLTGYRPALEAAEACADFCRRQAPYAWKQQLTPEICDRALATDQDWPFRTEVAGWALNAMGTYYAAFRDERFLRSMEALVDLFETWQDEEGRWRTQIGSFNRGAVPALNASVLQGLQHYYQGTGDIRAHRLLLRGTGFLVEKARTREGLFYRLESPIGDESDPAAALLLEPLAFVYRETGDAQILEAGYRLFRDLVDTNQVAPYMLKDLFAFMPLLEEQGLLDAYRSPTPQQAPQTRTGPAA